MKSTIMRVKYVLKSFVANNLKGRGREVINVLSKWLMEHQQFHYDSMNMSHFQIELVFCTYIDSGRNRIHLDRYNPSYQNISHIQSYLFLLHTVFGTMKTKHSGT